MRTHIGFLIAVLALGTSCAAPRTMHLSADETILPIRWQRMVDDTGSTCNRCGGTQEELDKAARTLGTVLDPLGIHVILEERELSMEECRADIMESNRIWIADKSLEDLLGAEVNRSVCGSCCGALGEVVECRTTSLMGQTYEVIPAQLIVKAGLKAASEIIPAPSAGSCCPTGDTWGMEGIR